MPRTLLTKQKRKKVTAALAAQTKKRLSTRLGLRESVERRGGRKAELLDAKGVKKALVENVGGPKGRVSVHLAAVWKKGNLAPPRVASSLCQQRLGWPPFGRSFGSVQPIAPL